MEYVINNRWTGKPQFTAEIECAADASDAFKRGLAVKWALKNGANLHGAYLEGADLQGADLYGADLRGAYLYDADLQGALLDFDHFKLDLFATLATRHAEIPGLVTAIKEGRIDGSAYVCECACLVGTLAKVGGYDVDTAFPNKSANNPAEQWFTMIATGDKPGDDTGGGYAATMALNWIEEYCAANGVAL